MKHTITITANIGGVYNEETPKRSVMVMDFNVRMVGVTVISTAYVGVENPFSIPARILNVAAAAMTVRAHEIDGHN